jgi:hypothetical protein
MDKHDLKKAAFFLQRWKLTSWVEIYKLSGSLFLRQKLDKELRIIACFICIYITYQNNYLYGVANVRDKLLDEGRPWMQALSRTLERSSPYDSYTPSSSFIWCRYQSVKLIKCTTGLLSWEKGVRIRLRCTETCFFTRAVAIDISNTQQPAAGFLWSGIMNVIQKISRLLQLSRCSYSVRFHLSGPQPRQPNNHVHPNSSSSISNRSPINSSQMIRRLLGTHSKSSTKACGERPFPGPSVSVAIKSQLPALPSPHFVIIDSVRQQHKD